MRENYIDKLTERIHEEKTKKYFKEVISSLYSGNNRSAVVMLYSVAITDIVLKLKNLKEVYDDSRAIDILNEIEQLQKANPTSPDWEKKLIELVKTKTKILDSAAVNQIESLQKTRHLSAHPILSEESELYEPSQMETKAHIGNILNSILTKPPLLSKEVVDGILESLEENKDILINDDKLESFLTSKYLNNINLTVELQVFKSLWKIAFKLTDERCHRNREVNVMAVQLLLKRNYEPIIKDIESKAQYYSRVDDETIGFLIEVFNLYPKIHELLNEDAKLQVERVINTSANFKFVSYFQSQSLQDHLDYVLGDNFNLSDYDEYWLDEDSAKYLFWRVRDMIGKNEALAMIVKLFINSHSYDVADYRFDKMIRPNLSLFYEEHFRNLINGINENGQIADRNAAKSTNTEILRMAVKKHPNFNYTGLRSFKHYPMD